MQKVRERKTKPADAFATTCHHSSIREKYVDQQKVETPLTSLQLKTPDSHPLSWRQGKLALVLKCKQGL